jgi:hypothetical protein
MMPERGKSVHGTICFGMARLAIPGAINTKQALSAITSIFSETLHKEEDAYGRK